MEMGFPSWTIGSDNIQDCAATAMANRLFLRSKKKPCITTI